jgi:hypothetical protein
MVATGLQGGPSVADRLEYGVSKSSCAPRFPRAVVGNRSEPAVPVLEAGDSPVVCVKSDNGQDRCNRLSGGMDEGWL